MRRTIDNQDSTINKKINISKDCRRSIVESRQLRKGFTLIELLIVFSITIILSTLAIAGYSSYNKTQKLTLSVNEVNTMLHTAKALTQAQTKPASCINFQGYQVQFCAVNGSTCLGGSSYELDIVCNGTAQLVDRGILPTEVKISSVLTQTPVISFQTINGGVTGYGKNIVLHLVADDSIQKTVTISQLGIIKIE